MSGIGSAQPIGTNLVKLNSITVYEGPDFSSFAQPFAPTGEEAMKFKWNWLPSLKSLITVGQSSWTLFTYNGEKLCIKPKTQFKHPVCFFPNTYPEFIRTTDLHKYRFEGVFAKCAPENKFEKTVELTNCREYGQSNGLEDIPDIVPTPVAAVKGRPKFY